MNKRNKFQTKENLWMLCRQTLLSWSRINQSITRQNTSVMSLPSFFCSPLFAHCAAKGKRRWAKKISPLPFFFALL